MGEHEAKEMIGDQITKANMQIDTQMSGLSSDLANGFTTEADLMPRFGGIEDAVQRKAKLIGLPVEALRKDAFSKANESILDAMVQGGDYAGAQKWASEHREWIDEKAIAHFDPLIKKGEEAKAAYDNVSSIMAKDLPFDEARKELHDKYKDNPMAFKTAEAELHAQFNAQKLGRMVSHDEAYGSVLDSIIGLTAGTKPLTSWRDIQKLPAFMSKSLDNEDRQKLEAAFDAEQRERKAALSGAGTGVSKSIDQAIEYNALMEDPRFKSGEMSALEIAARAKKLGGYFDNALATRRDLLQRKQTGQQALESNLAVTGSMVDKWLEGVGETASGKKGDKREAFFSMRGELFAATQKAELSERGRLGRALTEMEMDKLGRDVATKIKLQGGGERSIGLVQNISEIEMTPAENMKVGQMFLDWQKAMVQAGKKPPLVMTPLQAKIALDKIRKGNK
jgi:hypothetical protein